MNLNLERIFLIAASALAVYQVALAVGTAVFGDTSGSDWTIIGYLLVGAVMVAAGVKGRQALRWSGGLIAMGVVPSLLVFWTIIPPFIALNVMLYGVFSRTGASSPGGRAS